MNSGIELAERGMLPDVLVRLGIRSFLAERLRQSGANDIEAAGEQVRTVLGLLRTAPITVHTEAAKEQHYEVPAEFFQAVLGPRLKYSASLWPAGVTTLAEAEEAMLQLTSDRALLGDGQTILELGCGWGSLTLWMAEHFPHSVITAVCNSNSQREFVEARARERGLGNVHVTVCDVAALRPPGGFDRVVSVEMFEHVRNWEALLKRLAAWLDPGGRVFLHVFCHRQTPYLFETTGPGNWMGRNFFSGGMMPSFDLPALLAGPLVVEDRWAVSGRHYARTCRAWLRNQDRARKLLKPLFESVYEHQAGRWWRRWRIFFMACEELFRYRGGGEWFVGHYRLTRRQS